ncbi:MAG: dehydrogenase [Prevotellaceae bacterium]|nr:dehydrogenase [Prevotellaceae bacterium]
MADNFLERHREDYEKRKQRYLQRKKHLSKELRDMIAQRKSQST